VLCCAANPYSLLLYISLIQIYQAIAQDSRYAPGFRLKGQFLLANGHPEQAVIAFFQANSLEKDISSFTGDECAMP
jgi:hypothetical protein